MQKTYSKDEALIITEQYIHEQAQLMRQNLREKQKLTDRQYA